MPPRPVLPIPVSHTELLSFLLFAGRELGVEPIVLREVEVVPPRTSMWLHADMPPSSYNVLIHTHNMQVDPHSPDIVLWHFEDGRASMINFPMNYDVMLLTAAFPPLRYKVEHYIINNTDYTVEFTEEVQAVSMDLYTFERHLKPLLKAQFGILLELGQVLRWAVKP